MPDDATIRSDALLAARYDANRKSALVAYLLWFLLGAIAAQRFYTGRWFSALVYCVIHLVGWITTPILIGWIGIGLIALWWVLDAFLIPGWIRDHNNDVVDRLSGRT